MIKILPFVILLLARGPEEGSFERPRKLEPHQTTTAADAPPVCRLSVKHPRLAPGNRFRCRGIPFEVTFPKAYRFEQHWGNGWLSWQYSPVGRVILLSVKAAPWTLYRERWRGKVDNYLPRLLKSLTGVITPEIGTPETVEVPGADFARRVEFSAGDEKTGTAGVNLSVVKKGWVMQLMVTGKKGHPLRRGGEYFKKILSSVRVVPRTAPLVHEFESGARVELPPDAWILKERDQRGLENPTFMTASGMTIIQLIQVPSPKPCGKLAEADWKKLIGDLANRPDQKGRVNFGYSYFFDLAGARGFWANAELPAQFHRESGRRRDPAVAALICRNHNLFQLFSVATRATRRDFQRMIQDLVTSYRPGDR